MELAEYLAVFLGVGAFVSIKFYLLFKYL